MKKKEKFYFLEPDIKNKIVCCLAIKGVLWHDPNDPNEAFEKPRKLERESRGKSPNSYDTIQYNFLIEQAGIVCWMKQRSRKQKK